LKSLGWLLGVLATASCGFPRPADIGADDTGTTKCQLTAVEPSIANTNDIITIEGTFADAVAVNFPGDTSVQATLLGLHRATALVPASATEGALTITTCGSTVGSLPFRRASFAPELGVFEASLDQADGAQLSASLATARDSHTSTVIGRYLYALGGIGTSGPLSNVEQASINADGSLGPFATVPGINLVTGRQAHTTTVLGNYLYVIGGFGNSSLDSVERATIAPDGSLGPFSTVSDVALTTARRGHTSAVIGNHLYILGGFGSNVLNTVEQAIINVDGSLGPFATVPDVTLVTARYGHTTAVIGNYVYVLGGTGSNGSLQTVERANINGDGSLRPFALVSGATLMSARSGHTTAVAGNYIYVLGGIGGNTSLNSVERAPLDAEGSLGSFTTVPDVTLTTARHGHTTAVIGNYVYVLGGIDSDSLYSVERAALNANGSLGPLAIAPDFTLTTGRSSNTIAVVANYLYLLGGTGLGLGPEDIERTTLNPDGSLGPFTIVAGRTLTGRSSHTAAVVGNYLYVLGGHSFSGNSVERATINPDGSLGPFAPVSGLTLVTARESHTSAVAGNYVYVVGGNGNSGLLNDVERAPINADGSLGAFATVPDVGLVTARDRHTTAVVGNYLYVLGGRGGGGNLNSVERAPIKTDGSLGPFALVSGVTLVTDRSEHTSAVVGNFLYVFGGRGGTGYVNSVERAPINADGSLGAFAPVSVLAAASGLYGHTTAIVGNYLYVLGGIDPSGSFSKSVERAAVN
jgi:N-acetylneuraminic acid mutarotase